MTNETPTRAQAEAWLKANGFDSIDGQNVYDETFYASVPIERVIEVAGVVDGRYSKDKASTIRAEMLARNPDTGQRLCTNCDQWHDGNDILCADCCKPPQKHPRMNCVFFDNGDCVLHAMYCLDVCEDFEHVNDSCKYEGIDDMPDAVQKKEAGRWATCKCGNEYIRMNHECADCRKASVIKSGGTIDTESAVFIGDVKPMDSMTSNPELHIDINRDALNLTNMKVSYGWHVCGCGTLYHTTGPACAACIERNKMEKEEEKELYETAVKHDDGKTRFSLLPWEVMRPLLSAVIEARHEEPAASYFEREIDNHMAIAKTNWFNVSMLAALLLEEKCSESVSQSAYPWPALRAVAEVFTSGAKTYGDDNWKHGLSEDRRLDACRRHWAAYCCGEEMSGHGHHHLAHVLWYGLVGMWYDAQERKGGK